jgi:hypothetical protein
MLQGSPCMFSYPDTAKRRPPTWMVADLGLVLGLIIAAFLVYGEATRHVRYHSDEGRYMARGRYFSHLFVQHDLSRTKWGDKFETHTHPMLANYIVGGWLWGRGYDLETMPPPALSVQGLNFWLLFEQPMDQRLRVEDFPELLHAREPMIYLAAGAVSVLYVLGRILGGTVAGLAAASLMIVSPHAQEFLARAVSEPPLLFFILLSLLFSVLGVRRGRYGRLPLVWAVPLGVTLGLAVGTKLTALLSLAAVLAWITVLAARAAWQRRPGAPGTRLRRAWDSVRGWSLAAALAMVVFVASNPHLYPNPPLHVAHLFHHRAAVGETVQAASPDRAARMQNPLSRVGYVLSGSLIQGTWSGSRGFPVELMLATLGFGALAARAWRAWKVHGCIRAEAVVLVTVLAYVGGVSAGMVVAQPRYLVPTNLLGCLMSGLGLSVLIRRVIALSPVLLRRWPTVQATILGPPYP